MHTDLDVLLRLLNLLLIPGIVLIWRLAVRTTQTKSDIEILKTHIQAICAKLGIPCTIPKG